MTSISRPLRVVQVGFRLDPDGRDAKSLLRTWPTLSAVAKASIGAGVHVTVVQAAHRNEIVERDGVTYYFVDDTSRRPARVFDRVASLAPDVVHVLGLNAPRATRPLSRAVPNVPILVQDHGSAVPTGWRAKAWRLAHSPIAGVAFASREQATPWKRAQVLRADLPVFEVLENSSHFMPGERTDARRATGMTGDPCIFWTGRLDVDEDPMTMLAAVELSASTLRDVRLYCCFGNSPLLTEVERRIASSDVLAPRVTLLECPPNAELEARYRAADFLVQTSHHPGGGHSLLEAMACGTTPIVTDTVAARAIVGAVGSLTPVGNAGAMAESIVAWAARDRGKLRRATRARFDAALSFDVIGAQVRAAYESLLGIKPVVRATSGTLTTAKRTSIKEERRR